LRLQSAFRALEKENEVLRARYVKWQSDQPNAHLIDDKERTISSLRNQIVSLTNEISKLRSQSSVNVNVQSNSQ
jgi:hypothetical protein